MILVDRTNQNIDGKEGSPPTNVNWINRTRYKTFMVWYPQLWHGIDSGTYVIPVNK